MLRLLTYLVSFLKLLVLGKWSPPGHVYDVSAADFADLCESVVDLTERLGKVERQAESTRQKVYRDDGKKEAEGVVGVAEPSAQARQNFLANLGSGDEVPPGVLF